MSEVSDNIKYYRKKAKMTQDDLAKATNLSVSFVSKLETGNKEPSMETIFKISNALGVQPHDIIGSTSNLLAEFLKNIDPDIRDEISDEVFYSEFDKISNLLDDNGYEVNTQSSNGMTTVSISNESGMVSEMLEIDFINFGNDLIESIDRFTRFSIEEFLRINNSPRK